MSLTCPVTLPVNPAAMRDLVPKLMELPPPLPRALEKSARSNSIPPASFPLKIRRVRLVASNKISPLLGAVFGSKKLFSNMLSSVEEVL